MMVIPSEVILSWEIAAALMVIILVYRVVNWWVDPLRKIPGPPGFPFLGNTLDVELDSEFFETLIQRSRKYGPIWKQSSLFGGTKIYVSGAEFAKEVLVSNNNSFQRPYDLRDMLPYLGTGILTTNGRMHALQRRAFTPALSYFSVKGFIPTFNEKAFELVKNWTKKIDENHRNPIEADILNNFTQLTLDIIGKCGFGYDFKCITNGFTPESASIHKLVSGSFNMRRKLMEKLIPILQWIPSKERDEVNKAEALCYNFLQKVITARRDEMNHCSDDPLERNDLLQKILNLYEQQEVKITNMDVFHQVFTIILAGHETLSFTLTFAIFLLAKHYKIQESARLEISKVVRNSHMVTLEEVEQLSVLNNCIKETLRLYPVTITSSRKTIREVKLGPYCIPPRTTVSVCIAALNRDEKVWENGDDFDPARHNKQDKEDTLFSFNNLPFSRGPRMCMGHRFAKMEMKVVLAVLLQNFEFRLGKNQNAEVRGIDAMSLRPHPPPTIEIHRL